MTNVTRLPGPIADIWEWQMDGACREADPSIFFHPEGERGSARRNRDRAAQQICGSCPVLVQCRSHALSAQEPYGVWGGMTEAEREERYGTGRRRAS